MSYKGFYRPDHPEKYIGDPNNIIYRSLWERKFMYYCDHNENILKFSSEEIWIPYLSPLDSRVHKYFPDFYIKYKDASGIVKERQQKNFVLIEDGHSRYLLKIIWGYNGV